MPPPTWTDRTVHGLTVRTMLYSCSVNGFGCWGRERRGRRLRHAADPGQDAGPVRVVLRREWAVRMPQRGRHHAGLNDVETGEQCHDLLPATWVDRIPAALHHLDDAGHFVRHQIAGEVRDGQCTAGCQRISVAAHDTRRILVREDEMKHADHQ